MSNLSRQIPATVVREGGGVGWMRNPLPYRTPTDCDYVVPEGQHCNWGTGHHGACPER